MFPRKVCQSGSFNRWTTSRPILSIQLNCVRFKLQDSSSDSQSNLDQRKEERELPAAEQALLAAVSSRHIKNFAGVVKPARFCRRPAPALPRRRSNSVNPMDGLWTSSTDKTNPKSLPGPARQYCPRRTGIVQTPVPGPVDHRVTVAESLSPSRNSDNEKFASVVKLARFCSPDGLRRPCPTAALPPGRRVGAPQSLGPAT